jgi:hypothetical protein
LPRLKQNGVLVVYDPAQRYRELCLDLASDVPPATRRGADTHAQDDARRSRMRQFGGNGTRYHHPLI